MAETLKTYTFRGRGRPQMYPWDLWNNGKIWEVTRGIDFTVTPSSFTSRLYEHAAANKLIVQVAVNGDVVTFQFSDI